MTSARHQALPGPTVNRVVRKVTAGAANRISVYSTECDFLLKEFVVVCR